MKRAKIKKLIDKKVQGAIRPCRDVCVDFDKETIHKFRVAVKVIRSFLRLYRMQANDSHPKIPKSFKKLYLIAGSIRDKQLELEQLGEKKELLPLYTQRLRNQLAQQKQQWIKNYSEKVLHKVTKRLTSYDYSRLPSGSLDSFIENKIGFIGELGQKSRVTDEELHTIRKDFKDVIYNTKLANKKWKEANKKNWTLPAKQLDHLSAEIGDFNDDRIMLGRLQSFSSKALKPDEQLMIKTICEHIEIKLLDKKKAILNELEQHSIHR